MARILPNVAYSRSDSKMRDKPLTQVEAIVRFPTCTHQGHRLQNLKDIVYTINYAFPYGGNICLGGIQRLWTRNTSLLMNTEPTGLLSRNYVNSLVYPEP